MRVTLVTQWFPPERIRLPALIAEGLVELGHDVHVLTGFPNYPEGRIAAPYRQSAYAIEHLNSGVTVHRTPLFPSHDSSAGRRSLNYLSWAATSSVAAALKVPSPDVFLVYSSPVTASIPAVVASPLGRVPTALLLQDLWPDSITGSGMARGPAGMAMTSGMSWASRAIYRRADAIGVISPGMANVLEARGIPARKIRHTPNWVETRHLFRHDQPNEAERIHHGFHPGPRHFVYAGNIGPLQRLEPVIQAFAGVEGAHLTVLGDGIERQRLARLVDQLKATNIRLPGACPPEDVGTYLACADALVLSLDDTPLLRVTMPSKVQTYLASGQPILAHAAGDPAEMVERAGAGLTAPPGAVHELRERIAAFVSASDQQLTEWGTAGTRFYSENLDRSQGLVRLEALLQHARGEA